MQTASKALKSRFTLRMVLLLSAGQRLVSLIFALRMRPARCRPPNEAAPKTDSRAPTAHAYCRFSPAWFACASDFFRT